MPSWRADVLTDEDDPRIPPGWWVKLWNDGEDGEWGFGHHVMSLRNNGGFKYKAFGFGNSLEEAIFKARDAFVGQVMDA